MSIKSYDWPGLLQKDCLREIAQDLAVHASGQTYEWRINPHDSSKVIFQLPKKSYTLDLDPHFACCLPLLESSEDFQTPSSWPGPVKGMIEGVYIQKEVGLVLLSQQEPIKKGWLIRLAARLPNIVWIDQSPHPLHESTFSFSLDSLEKVNPVASTTPWQKLWFERKNFIEIEQTQKLIEKYFENELHKNQTRLEKITRSKKRAPDSLSIRHEAELLQAYGNSFSETQNSLVVWDWIHEKEIELEKPKEEIHGYIKGLFHKAKGFESHLKTLDQQIEALEKKKLNLLLEKEKALSTLTLPFSKTPPKPASGNDPLLKGIRKFERAGAIFLVGKSSEDNMRLTFKIAHGNDLWLHVQDYPGSHVVVKKASAETRLDSDEILTLASLLAHHFSSARKQSQVEVSWTWAKWVKKLPGVKTGTVGLQESKRYFSQHNSELLAQLMATSHMS